jgi:hypothetical protein
MAMVSVDSAPRKTALARPITNCILYRILSSERAVHINKPKKNTNWSQLPDECLTL